MLQAAIGGQVITVIFGVPPKLAAKMILGTAFITKKIKPTEGDIRQVVPNSGHAVLIVESFEDAAGVQSLKDDKRQEEETSETNLPTKIVALNTTLRPRGDAPVSVRTIEEKTLMVESLQHKTYKNCPQMAKSILKILLIQFFSIKVVNTSKLFVTLPKIVKVLQPTEAQSTVVSLKNTLLFKPANATPIYKEKQNKMRRFAQY